MKHRQTTRSAAATLALKRLTWASEQSVGGRSTRKGCMPTEATRSPCAASEPEPVGEHWRGTWSATGRVSVAAMATQPLPVGSFLSNYGWLPRAARPRASDGLENGLINPWLISLPTQDLQRNQRHASRHRSTPG